MQFKLKNSNIFPLPNNSHILHLATIEKGMQEFIVMACIRGPKKGNIYIEEVVLTSVDWTKDVFANCKFINDDMLAEDLARFAETKGITNMENVIHRIMTMGKQEWLIS